METAQAVILASFGTVNADSRREALDILAEETADVFPQCRVFQAYTSNFVRRRMAADGFAADSLTECLGKLAERGCRRVLVQPTHLSPGEEYENKILPLRDEFAASFEEFLLGEPVFCRREEYEPGLRTVTACFPLHPGEQLVLLGHGSPHRHNPVYEGLQQLADEKAMPLHIGVVEDSDTPDFSMVRSRLEKNGGKQILLAPLLLTGGTHVTEDMAGGGRDSWKSRLQALGLEVRVCTRSLGTFPEFRRIYLNRMQKLLDG